MLDNLHTPTQQEARDYFLTRGIASSQADKWWQRQEQYRWCGKLRPQESADQWIAHTDARFYLTNQNPDTPDCPPVQPVLLDIADQPLSFERDPRDPPYRQSRTYSRIVFKLRYRDFLSPKEKRLIPRYRQYWALYNRKYPHRRPLNIDAV